MPDQPDGTVEVVPYSDRWPADFERERAALAAAIGDVASSIEHIGSTAVPGLAAKPTIDVLVVVDDLARFLDRLPAVEALGYEDRPGNEVVGSELHRFLRKVVAGKRTHHLHVVVDGSPEVERYRRFRDGLRADAALAARYARHKEELAARYADERMRYVEEKSRWIDAVLRELGIVGGSSD